MKFWLHRISHCGEASYPLLSRGYLTIGFSDFSDPQFIAELANRAPDDNWNYFEQRFQEEWGSRNKGTLSLWKFILGMKAGDWVLVPTQGAFSVYEILDDLPLCIRDVETTGLTAWGLANGDPIVLAGHLLSQKGQNIDLGFARRVRRIEDNISRASFADAALTSRMKTRWTTSDICDLQHSVERSLSAYRSNRPIDLHATLLEAHTNATLDAIKRNLDDTKFEKLVAWYFEKVGANRVDRPSKNESGKEGDGDIVATFDALRAIIYVQAKSHWGLTGDWAAEQITAYRNQKEAHGNSRDALDDGYARIAWVISTADDFTPECRSLAKENKVLLLNGRDFAKLLLNAGIEGLDAAFF
jgi:predicted Mrr-cat superfamily restriction endonuclease